MMKKILSVILIMLIVSSAVAFAYESLQIDSRGDMVVRLQEMLIDKGYLNGRADGIYGRMTQASVMAFQRENDLPETGIADDNTQKKLYGEEDEKQLQLPLSRGAYGEEVKALQTRLIELGYFADLPDGYFELSTRDALILFQVLNGLSATGIADMAVLDALYADSAKPNAEEKETPENEQTPDAWESESTPEQQTDGESESEDLNPPQTETADDVELLSEMTTPSEDYIITRLSEIPDIVKMVVVTEETARNGYLKKVGGYIAQINFSSTLVSSVNDSLSEMDIIRAGADYGGSVEVYGSEDDAKRRDAYLATFDKTVLNSGAHTVVGTVIIRTSRLLTSVQQKKLEKKIIKALTANGTPASEDESQDELEVNDAAASTVGNGETALVSVKEMGYEVAGGKLYCCAIVHNNSPDMTVRFPEFRMVARDVYGNMLGSQSAFLKDLYPGQNATFSVALNGINREPSSVDVEFIEPEYYNLINASNMGHKEYLPLEVRAASLKKRRPDLLTGEIYNPNSYDISSVAVTVAYRNENGKLIGGETAICGKIEAVANMSFEIAVKADIAHDNFEVYAMPW